MIFKLGIYSQILSPEMLIRKVDSRMPPRTREYTFNKLTVMVIYILKCEIITVRNVDVNPTSCGCMSTVGNTEDNDKLKKITCTFLAVGNFNCLGCQGLASNLSPIGRI